MSLARLPPLLPDGGQVCGLALNGLLQAAQLLVTQVCMCCSVFCAVPLQQCCPAQLHEELRHAPLQLADPLCILAATLQRAALCAWQGDRKGAALLLQGDKDALLLAAPDVLDLKQATV